MVGELLEFIKTVWVSVSSEAGIAASLLFLWGVYQTIDNRGLRKELRQLQSERFSESKELNAKIYDMGMKQVQASIEANNVYDKISDTLTAFSSKKGRSQ